MRRILTALMVAWLLPAALLLGLALPASESDLTLSFLEHLRFLSSDRLKGRGNGTPELEEAADYIARGFRQYGLEPAGEAGTYFQSFKLTIGKELGPANRLVLFDTPALELEVGPDYLPLSLGEQKTVEGPLVFVGFGISAPELNYDDYHGRDVTGKLVVAFEHEPQEQRQDSPFSGQEMTPYGSALHKILNAKQRGAVGLLLLSDWFQHAGEQQRIASVGQVEKLGLNAVRLSELASKRLMGVSRRNPLVIVDWINGHLTPYSFQFGLEASLSVDMVEARRTIRNVLGRVSGRSHQTIVVGAHYDHLGLGENGSLAENSNQIHNGADDNASGTAGLLELARQFGGNSLPRSLLFVAFAGEELGLLGSRHYTEYPAVPLEDTLAMVNLDMIGRSQGDLIIGGVGSADPFEGLLDELRHDSPLMLTYNRAAIGSSDHQPFAAKKIPVLFFFTGLHRDYHRPSDDWERINLPRTGQVLELVHATIDGLLQMQEEIAYREVPGEERRQNHNRPRMGILPDMSWALGGVRVEHVLRNSAADRAGLEGGDILLTFDGQFLRNLNGLISLLKKTSAGDEVELTGLRNGEPVRFSLRLVR